VLRLTKTDFKQAIEKDKMLLAAMRKQILLNLEALNKALKESKNLSEFTLRKDGEVRVLFFNVINGLSQMLFGMLAK
jgi:hypothetical protein